jgi:pimeloyl-ACP methyl ester carboxylesterase
MKQRHRVLEVDVGGLRIAYRRAGEGPPLVLLHGGLSDGREWRRQLDGLSDELSVIAWDAPGCGRSSDPPESFRLPDYAECLAAFIDALGLSRPHVAGLSFGAGLALELYRRRPSIPASLVLASAYAGWAGSLPAEVAEQRLQYGLRVAELPPEQWVAELIPGLFAESAPPELIEEAVAIMSDSRPAGIRAMARAFAEADLRDVLPHIDVPTLLLQGGADRRSSSKVAEELHAGIASSTLVVMPGVGHSANMEAPERFNAEVRAFLRSIRA